MSVVDRAILLVGLAASAWLAYEWDQTRLRQIEEARDEGRRDGLHDAWAACPYTLTSCSNEECEWQHKDDCAGVASLLEWHLDRRWLDAQECMHLGGCTASPEGEPLDEWQAAYVQQRQMHRARWEPDVPGHWDHPNRGGIEIEPDFQLEPHPQETSVP